MSPSAYTTQRQSDRVWTVAPLLVKEPFLPQPKPGVFSSVTASGNPSYALRHSRGVRCVAGDEGDRPCICPVLATRWTLHWSRLLGQPRQSPRRPQRAGTRLTRIQGPISCAAHSACLYWGDKPSGSRDILLLAIGPAELQPARQE